MFRILQFDTSRLLYSMWRLLCINALVIMACHQYCTMPDCSFQGLISGFPLREILCLCFQWLTILRSNIWHVVYAHRSSGVLSLQCIEKLVSYHEITQMEIEFFHFSLFSLWMSFSQIRLQLLEWQGWRCPAFSFHHNEK